jgi:hypothetical protein
MKKWLSFVLCLLSVGFFGELYAQKGSVGGEWAAGARFGGATGVTLKKYSRYNTSAIEFLGGWNFDNALDGVNVSALWEKLAPLTGSKKLSAEFGLGATAIFGDKFYFGPTGVAGFDWRLKSVPITMSVDWMPTWIIVGTNRWSWSNAAYSIRWVLNHKRYK